MFDRAADLTATPLFDAGNHFEFFSRQKLGSFFVPNLIPTRIPGFFRTLVEDFSPRDNALALGGINFTGDKGLRARRVFLRETYFTERMGVKFAGFISF